MSKSPALDTLASLEWNEDPSFTLHEWRVRIALVRGGKSLQVEYMSLPGYRNMIVSVVGLDGTRGDEALVPPEGMRQLRTLLNATDLEDHSAEPGEEEK